VPWDEFHIAFSKLRAGEAPHDARAIVEGVLERTPGTWQGEYNAACFEAVAGDADAAFAHLRTALERNRDGVARYARDDTDLASLRDDPRWAELLG
jgi:thioredoxin-like negative regulator of GroEL